MAVQVLYTHKSPTAGTNSIIYPDSVTYDVVNFGRNSHFKAKIIIFNIYFRMFKNKWFLYHFCQASLLLFEILFLHTIIVFSISSFFRQFKLQLALHPLYQYPRGDPFRLHPVFWLVITRVELGHRASLKLEKSHPSISVGSH